MRWHPVWSQHGFRALWAASGVSLIGTQVSVLALPLTALVALHASPGQVALLAAAGTAPFLLLGLPAGAWADRWARRRLMVFCDVGRGVLLATLPVAQLAGVLTLLQLYVVALGVGALSVFFDIASLSVLPALVRPDQIAPANARLEVVRATAQTSGPALGGVLVQALTAPVALAVDALSYGVSALLLRGLPPVPSPTAAARSGGLLVQVRAGLRFCLTHPYIRPLAVGAAWLNFWTEGLLAVFLTYAVRELRLSPATVGTVLAVAGLGYLAGSLLTPRLNASIGVGPAIVVGAALNAGFLLAAWAPSTGTTAWLLLGFTVTAIGVSVWNVNAVSLRQATTPDDLLARMNAANRFLIWGTMPLGAAAGGLLADLLGLHLAVIVCALAAPASALPVVFSAVRKVASMPRPPATTGLAPAADPTPAPTSAPTGTPTP
ncbi:MFS transporter [Streptomyces sp. NPDC006393]|uniref:MFS transporter n=1 Tax=Streptomyces sp. NPDC006393 TaxID=3156763 RepID=UPI0033F2C16C